MIGGDVTADDTTSITQVQNKSEAENISLTAAEQALSDCLPASPASAALAQFGLPGRRCEGWRWSDLRKALEANQTGPISARVNLASDASGDPLNITPNDARSNALNDVSSDRLVSRSDDADDRCLAHGPVWPDLAEKNSIYINSIDGDICFPSDLPAGVAWRSDRLLNLREEISTPGALVPALARQMAFEKNRMRLTGNIDRPIVMQYHVTGPGVVAGYFDLRLDAGVTATLIEMLEPHWAGFANRYMHISLGAGAQLTHLVIQAESPEAVIIHHTDISLAAEARYVRTSLGFGARLARLQTDLSHEAADARAILNAAYLVSGKSHIDMTSHIDHRALGCETTQLVKGVASGTARGVFQGKFQVARDAQHTDAKMTHNALMLSPEAEVRAKPELEIYADDVACAHGNTIGALNDDAVFYLMQRGLSREAARALLVKAFLGEVFDQIEDEEVRQHLITLAADAMEGSHGV